MTHWWVSILPRRCSALHHDHGTTPTNKEMWSWNTVNPFDLVLGLPELQTDSESRRYGR